MSIGGMAFADEEREQDKKDLQIICGRIGKAKRYIDEAESMMQKLIQKKQK